LTELAEIESERVEGACLVRVRGEIDMTNASSLSTAIENAMPNGVPTLVLDLSDTTYLDSSGVALLLRLAERLRSRRQELRLVVPLSSPIKGVLDLSGIAGAVRVESGTREALTNPPQPG